MTTTALPPPAVAALATLARVTLLRLLRSRSLWVSALIASLPILLALILRSKASEALNAVDLVNTLVMVLVPAMFVASSVGEEIEDRTTTYLWSRPMPRWTIIAGKLLALVPASLVLVVPAATLAGRIAGGGQTGFWQITGTAASVLAISAGVVTFTMIAAALGVLVPKHGMALAIVYGVIVDIFLGGLPTALGNISVTNQVRLIATDVAVVAPLITLAVIATLWLTIALWRVRRMEA